MRIRKFNESAEFEELEDTLLEIYDLLGNPEKSEYNIGGKLAYTLVWPMGFRIDEYNGYKEIDLISKVFDLLKVIKSSQLRIKDYDVEFKIENRLFVRLTPHSSEVSTSYEFFVEDSYNGIILSYSEISKFLKDRGYRVKSAESDSEGSSESSTVVISTDAPRSVCSDLAIMINSEIEESCSDPISVYSGDGFISITPEEECFVRLDRYN